MDVKESICSLIVGLDKAVPGPSIRDSETWGLIWSVISELIDATGRHFDPTPIFGAIVRHKIQDQWDNIDMRLYEAYEHPFTPSKVAADASLAS